MSAASARPRPKVERKPPLPPVDSLYHRIRKRWHLAFFLVFVALPFSNVIRFDIPRQRFFFAGFELWINEFAIIFFALMFLMFLVAASAIIHGRIYCGYACPQMIFSEWSLSVQSWCAKRAGAWLPKATKGRKTLLGRLLWLAILGIASVFLAFAFTAYFLEPRDLLRRLLHLDLATAGGMTGAVVTLVAFLDFTLVRLNFCKTVCPYGYLQGMLQDDQTLLVEYQDPNEACIECGKCVRVCQMGIDIRKGPFQIECVHCGDCVDACEDVLRRIGTKGLIHYGFGEGAVQDVREPWHLRLGFRDAKRVLILLVILAYAAGLGFALSTRHAVMVRVAPDRSILFTRLGDGRIANRTRIELANRSGKEMDVRVWTEGLPGAELGLQPNPVRLPPGATLQQTFEVRAAPWPGATDVSHFQVMVQYSGQRSPEAFPATFILPLQGK